MSKSNKVAKNATYQTIYQILTLLTPLITSPIISRVLGAESVGIFSYSYSVISYFLLVSMLGIVNYGTRVIAQCNNEKSEISKNFINIYSVQIITSLISILFYVIYIFFIDEKVIAIIQGIWLISSLFDINWLFFGVEDFKLTVKKNIVIKILTVLSIVLFIRKGPYSLFIYTFIMSFGQLLSVIVLFPSLKKYIDFVKPNKEEIKKHIKPIIVLFGPLLATSVFHLMDKTMLGQMAGYEELGFYYNADKLINIPLGIINGLGTVFLPRATVIFDRNPEEGISFLNNTFRLNTFISVALSFGIAGCSPEFVPMFFGSGFKECIFLVYLFVPVLMVKSMSIFYRMQFLVPNKMDKLYSIATVLGAIVNLISNIILIKFYGAIGAVIGTFLAELTVMIVQLYKPIYKIPLKKWIFCTIFYVSIGALMWYIMRLVSSFGSNLIVKVIIEVFVGGLVYLVLTGLFILVENIIKQKVLKIKKEN